MLSMFLCFSKFQCVLFLPKGEAENVQKLTHTDVEVINLNTIPSSAKHAKNKERKN